MNGNAAHEVFIVTTAVIGSAASTSMVSTGRSALPVRMPSLAQAVFSSVQYCQVKTTSSAVNGVPSWNVTPSRAVMDHTV